MDAVESCLASLNGPPVSANRFAQARDGIARGAVLPAPLPTSHHALLDGDGHARERGGERGGGGVTDGATRLRTAPAGRPTEPAGEGGAVAKTSSSSSSSSSSSFAASAALRGGEGVGTLLGTLLGTLEGFHRGDEGRATTSDANSRASGSSGLRHDRDKRGDGVDARSAHGGDASANQRHTLGGGTGGDGGEGGGLGLGLGGGLGELARRRAQARARRLGLGLGLGLGDELGGGLGLRLGLGLGDGLGLGGGLFFIFGFVFGGKRRRFPQPVGFPWTTCAR